MPAAILLLRLGRHGWPMPLPFFLLWPLVVLAAPLVGLLRLVSPGQGRRSAAWRYGWIGLRAFGQLHGIKVDACTRDGQRVYLWFI